MTKIDELLDELAYEQMQKEIDFEYDIMMTALMNEYHMKMYEANSYDMDAEHYGMEIV